MLLAIECIHTYIYRYIITTANIDRSACYQPGWCGDTGTQGPPIPSESTTWIQSRWKGDDLWLLKKTTNLDLQSLEECLGGRLHKFPGLLKKKPLKWKEISLRKIIMYTRNPDQGEWPQRHQQWQRFLHTTAWLLHTYTSSSKIWFIQQLFHPTIHPTIVSSKKCWQFPSGKLAVTPLPIATTPIWLYFLYLSVKMGVFSVYTQSIVVVYPSKNVGMLKLKL